MARMVYLEIKSYAAAWRAVLAFLAAGLLVGAVLWLGAGELAARGSLFEPFTVGVVDHDGTPELIFIYDFFNEYVIDLQFMEKGEALTALSAGDIPVFIELPRGFTRDVFHGYNSPFSVHVGGGFPLQANMVRLLASGGIAFLSASQAGTYATLGLAGDGWEAVLLPVNLAFAQELIRYDEMFSREVVDLVEGSAADYFAARFAVFWYMLGLLALSLKGYSAGILARFQLAGVSALRVFLIRWSGLFVAVAVIGLPAVPVLGVAVTLALAVCISAFGLFAGRIYSRALVVFFVALAMYFASGGIVPFAFLPRVMLPMRWFSLNYYAAGGDIFIILIIGIVMACFSFGLDLKARRG